MAAPAAAPDAEAQGGAGSEPVGRAAPAAQGEAQAPAPPGSPAADEEESIPYWADLLCCFFGLQFAYITWGVMQEKVMTETFLGGRFPSPTFCVFCNRLLAVMVGAGMAYRATKTLQTPAPFYAFSYCSMSNVLSSYGQYAALQYASFPLQVLFKSSKIIPVMGMGKVLNGKSYKWVEYAEAIVITAGVATFSLADSETQESADRSQSTTKLIGILLLTLYVCCDSFTSQWQTRLYTSYPDKKALTQYHMMFYVNAWSIILTASWLILSGEGLTTIQFLMRSPDAVPFISASAVVAAIGQMFIYYTIKKHGPILFTIIMTTRQMLSMVISCIFFGHPVSKGMGLGAVLVFSAVFYGLHRKMTSRGKSGGAKGGEQKPEREPPAAAPAGSASPQRGPKDKRGGDEVELEPFRPRQGESKQQ
eukprot:TRINITY_DN4684_c1_g2_i1.p2 TRINITY_DN4684_c1_g2~~TRINITY_DN4684_c1_g2_i1.p2  ORF type:complete len:456 (+),score=156.73 TRINITY_DN4684_c1_g2_i1:111-1370(+)